MSTAALVPKGGHVDPWSRGDNHGVRHHQGNSFKGPANPTAGTAGPPGVVRQGRHTVHRPRRHFVRPMRAGDLEGRQAVIIEGERGEIQVERNTD